MASKDDIRKAYKEFLEENFECWSGACEGPEKEYVLQCDFDPYDAICPFIEKDIVSIRCINIPGMNLALIKSEKSIRVKMARINEEGEIIGVWPLWREFEEGELEEGNYTLEQLIKPDDLIKCSDRDPLIKGIIHFMKKDDKEFLEHFADYLVKGIKSSSKYKASDYLSKVYGLISEYGSISGEDNLIDFMNDFVVDYLLKRVKKEDKEFLSNFIEAVVEEKYYSKGLVRFMDENGELEKYIKFNTSFAYEFAEDMDQFSDIVNKMSDEVREYLSFLREHGPAKIANVCELYDSGVKLPKYALSMFVDGSFAGRVYEEYKDTVMEIYEEALKLGYHISADPQVQRDYEDYKN